MQSITLRGVSKNFGKVRALDDIQLEIEAGKRLVLIGGSGAGKTTLLRILAGLESPDRGSIYGGDTDITRTPAHQRGIAMLSQDYAIYPHLTVERNLLAALEPLRLDARELRERTESALSGFDLLPLRDRRPAQLSGGQMQRAAIAKALVRRPQLLVLDEPLSQLDPALREQSRELILSMTEQFGTTVLMVTHDALDAMRLADRLAVLEAGKLVQVDKPQAVYSRPNSRSVAEILSPFGINQFGQARFRPESARLVDSATERGPTDLLYAGSVKHLQYLGFATLACIDVVKVVESGAASNAPESGTTSVIKILVFERNIQVGDQVCVRVAQKDLL
ncbi:MAG: ABC transporter ATP-binding protein [Pirellulaceae bacterium]|nr:ABC transporter ATP-binding protein [Pirellulaceae bacterium]